LWKDHAPSKSAKNCRADQDISIAPPLAGKNLVHSAYTGNIDRRVTLPIHLQVRAHFRTAIVTGHPGPYNCVRVPCCLATQLNTARGTGALTYTILVDEVYLRMRVPTDIKAHPDASPESFLGASGLWRYARIT
jgi:hypothetical protein